MKKLLFTQLFFFSILLAFGQTTFDNVPPLNGGSNNNGGNIFNFTTNQSITINNFRGSFSTASGTVTVWYNPQKVNGQPSINAASGWVNLGSASMTGLTANASSIVVQTIPVPINLILNPGDTIGVAIQWTGNVYTTTNTNIPTFTDGTVTLIADASCAYNMNSSMTIFSSPRQINGGVIYSLNGPCASPPTAGTALANNSVVCIDTPVILSLSGASYGAGLTVQWQSSIDGITYSNIVGLNNFSATVTQADTTWYRAILTCSGVSDTSTSVVVNTISNSLSGVYTLNPSFPTSGTNFAAFAEFQTAISCHGISGPVTLNVAPGTYTGPWSLTGWIGASASNMVTIQPNSTMSGIVTVNHASLAAADGFVLSLTGVSYLTINGITLNNTGATFSRNVEFFGTCHHVYFDEMTFNRPTNAAASTNTAALYKNSSTISSLEVTNSVFNNGYGAYFSFGSISAGMGDSIRFVNNTLNNINGYCFYLTSVRNLEIIGNSMTINSSSLTYGIYASANHNISQNSRIVVKENDIRINGTSLKYGMYIEYFNPISGFYNEILNNMVSIAPTAMGATYGASFNHIANTKFYHNSIYVGGGSASANNTAISFNQLTTGFTVSGNDFRNNIITNFGPGYVVNIALNAANNSNFFNNVNSNLYYSQGATPFRRYITNYSNLQSWQAATARDGSSLFGNPGFIGGGDLHLVGSLANNAGDNTLGVNYDIDGEVRPAQGAAAVDIGADEYTPPGCATPAVVLLSAITDVSFTATWFAGSAAQLGYVVQYGPVGFTLGSGTIDFTTNTAYTATNLSQQTSYDFYVLELCAVADSSNWVGPFTFTTVQSVVYVFPYFEGFENGTNNWILNNGAQINQWHIGNAVSYAGTSSAYISNDNGVTNAYTGTTSSVTHLYRDFQLPSGSGEVNINFYWKAFGQTTVDYFRVWLVPISFNPVPGVQITAVGSGPLGRVKLGTDFNQQINWTSESFILPPSYEGQQFRLVFEWRNNPSTANQPPVAIDNLSINVSNCLAPTNISSTISAVDTIMNLSWLSSASLFNLEIGPAGFTPTGTPTDIGVGNPYVATGLTAGVTYHCYVQAVCGVDSSVWIGPHTFVPGVVGLSTTPPLVANASCSGGVTFELMSLQAVTVYSIASLFTGPGTVSIWIRPGGVLHPGATSPDINTTNGWTEILAPTAFSNIIDVPIIIPGNYSFQMPANTVYGVYIQGPTRFKQYSFHPINFTDGNMTIITGPGVGFGCNPPITPTRQFTGTVYYSNPFSCFSVSNVIASGITTNGLHLNWDPGNAGSSNWLIEYGPFGFTPGHGTFVSSTTHSYTFNNLSPSTYYSFYVKEICSMGSDTSVAVAPVTYQTLCATGTTPYLQDFNYWPPSCWDLTGGTQTVSQLNYGQNSYLRANLYAWNLNDYALVTTEPITISSNSNVSFRWSHEYRSYLPDDQMILRMRLANGTTWDTLATFYGPTFNSPGASPVTPSPDSDFITEVVAINPSYTGQDVVFQFSFISGWGPDVYIDDFRVEPMDCSAPNSPTVLSTSSNSAILNWTVGHPTSTTWFVEYGLAGFLPSTGTTVQVNTAPPFTLTGLSPSTNYSYRVRELCLNGLDTTHAISDASFATLCIPDSIPYLRDFNSWPPTCWDLTGGTQTVAQANGNYLVAPSGSFGNFALATTEPIYLSANARVRFRWSHRYISWGQYKDLILMARLSDSATWDTLANFSGPSFNSPGAQSFDPAPDPNFLPAIFDLNPAIYTNQEVVFKFIFNADDGSSVFIDDFIVEPLPPCPDPTSPEVLSTSSSSAILNWTVGNPSSTTWFLEYGPPGFSLGTGTQVQVNAPPPYTLTGLVPETNYAFRVRELCLNGVDTSVSISAAGFATLCATAGLPYLRDFNTWPPICWDLTGGTQTVTQYVSAQGNYLRAIFSSSNQGNFLLATTEPINISSNARVRFRWSHRYQSFYPNDQMIFLVRLANGVTWDTLANFIGPSFNTPGASSNSPAPDSSFIHEAYYLDPAMYTNQEVVFRFVFNSGNGPPLYLDDFIVEPISPCTEPTSPSVLVTSSNSALLDWVVGNTTSTTWIVEYGPAGFLPGTGTAVQVNAVPPYLLTGLSPTTNYSFRVRELCLNGVDTSFTSSSTSFETLCATDSIPYLSDFNTWPPPCWDLTGGTQTVSHYSSTQGNYLRANFFDWNPGNTAWVTTVPVNINTDARVRFRWSHPHVSSIYSDQMILLVRLASSTTWDTLANFIGPTFHSVGAGFTTPSPDSNFVLFVSDLNPAIYTNQDVVFKFEFISGFGSNAFIDDFIVEPIPLCLEPTSLTVQSTSSNSAILNWAVGNPSATTWFVEYGPPGFSSGTGTTVQVNSTPPYTLTGLMPETDYSFRVRELCLNGVDTSYSISAASFSTLCLPESIPYLKDFNTWPPICWSLGGGSAAVVQHTIPQGSYLRAEFWNWSSGTFALATTEPISISTNVRVRFRWSHLYLATSPDDRMIFMVRLANSASWDTLGNFIGPSFTTPGAAVATPAPDLNFIIEEFNLNPTIYTNQDVVFRFVFISGNGTSVFVDDFFVDPVPVCLEPTSLVALTTSSNTATLSWSVGNPSATTWFIEYGPSGFSPGAGTTVQVNTPPPYILQGLSPTTNYTFYLRELCPNGVDTSYSYTSASFTTAGITSNLPYLRDFNAWPPLNWDLTGGSQTVSQFTNAQGSYLKANFWGWQMYHNAIATTEPIFMNSDAELSFRWSHLYNASYPNDQMVLRMRLANGTVWDTIVDFIGPAFNSPGATNNAPGSDSDFITEQFAINPTYVGQYVVFQFVFFSGYGPDVFVDDFRVDPLPIVQLCDNFDTYTSSVLVPQSSLWEGWMGGPDYTEVSTEQFRSAPNSAKIYNINATQESDVVLGLGDHSAGSHKLDFWFYVPATNGGYFNLMHQYAPATSGYLWAAEVYLNGTNGTGTIEWGSLGTGTIGTFNFNAGAWNRCRVVVDLDNDEATMTVNNQTPITWIWSNGSTNLLASHFAALNLYSTAPTGLTPMLYIDDLCFGPYSPPCVVSTQPTGSSASFCQGAPATLTATPGDPQNYVVWANSTGQLIGEGSSFVTMPMQDTTTLGALDADIIGNEQAVGPLTGLTGGHQNVAIGLYVSVERPMYIDSMLVNSDGSLVMAVNVWNHNQAQLIRRSDTISLTGAGDHRIAVGMTIAPGNYFFNVEFISGPGQLFRSTDGASYPYVIQDMMSIDSVNFVNQMQYYYLFEWGVREVCLGAIATSITANPIPVQADISGNQVSVDATEAVWQFNGNGSLGATSYSWNFGDGSTGTGATPTHAYSANGQYTVELTIQTQCGPRSTTFQITVQGISVEENGLAEMSVYPNPTRDQLVITFESGQVQTIRLELVNSLGQQIWAETVQNHSGTYRKELSLGAYAKGIYHLRIHTATGTHTERISLQ